MFHLLYLLSKVARDKGVLLLSWSELLDGTLQLPFLFLFHLGV
jgi:hypothetical protein